MTKLKGAEDCVLQMSWSSAFLVYDADKTKKYFLIENGYFYTLYLINRQITNLEVVLCMEPFNA